MEKNSIFQKYDDQNRQDLQEQKHEEEKKAQICQEILSLSTTHGKELNQDSPGFLKKQDSIVHLPEYIPLPLEEIEPYKGIDDYIEPTISPCPVIFKTPTNCHCIDGFNLVEKAVQEKMATIVCHVFHEKHELSESELALRKTGIRMISEQGMPHYPEIVRNCKKTLTLLEKTIKKAVMTTHGGKRKGKDYIPNNEEDNLRLQMAKYLGQSPITINSYINYGSYLDDNILETLVKSKEKRDFFEKASPNKNQLIRDLKSEQKNVGDITSEVSKYMTQWLMEYRENGKIERLTYEENIALDDEPPKDRCRFDPLTEFNHHGECVSDQVEDTFETLNEKIITILDELRVVVKESSELNCEYMESLKGGVRELAPLIAKMEGLSSTLQTGSTNEVL